MSAQELRRAAATERQDWGGVVNGRLYPKASAIHLAVADWLDLEAEHVESHDCEAHCAYPDGGPRCRSALTLARIINHDGAR